MPFSHDPQFQETVQDFLTLFSTNELLSQPFLKPYFEEQLSRWGRWSSRGRAPALCFEAACVGGLAYLNKINQEPTALTARADAFLARLLAGLVIDAVEPMARQQGGAVRDKAVGIVADEFLARAASPRVANSAKKRMKKRRTVIRVPSLIGPAEPQKDDVKDMISPMTSNNQLLPDNLLQYNRQDAFSLGPGPNVYYTNSPNPNGQRRRKNSNEVEPGGFNPEFRGNQRTGNQRNRMGSVTDQPTNDPYYVERSVQQQTAKTKEYRKESSDSNPAAKSRKESSDTNSDVAYERGNRSRKTSADSKYNGDGPSPTLPFDQFYEPRYQGNSSYEVPERGIRSRQNSSDTNALPLNARNQAAPPNRPILPFDPSLYPYPSNSELPKLDRYGQPIHPARQQSLQPVARRPSKPMPSSNAAPRKAPQPPFSRFPPDQIPLSPTEEYRPRPEFNRVPPVGAYSDFSRGPAPASELRGGPPTNPDFRGPAPFIPDYRGPPPGADLRAPPPGTEFRGPPPLGMDFRGPPPGSDFRGPPPGTEFRGPPPPGNDYRGPFPPNADFRMQGQVGGEFRIPPGDSNRRAPNSNMLLSRSPPEAAVNRAQSPFRAPAYRDPIPIAAIRRPSQEAAFEANPSTSRSASPFRTPFRNDGGSNISSRRPSQEVDSGINRPNSPFRGNKSRRPSQEDRSYPAFLNQDPQQRYQEESSTRRPSQDYPLRSRTPTTGESRVPQRERRLNRSGSNDGLKNLLQTVLAECEDYMDDLDNKNTK
ncbi:hypothetical protein HDV02_000985 [Globomyces sp. JEL0801]|nr:hypothetical protein HDV02_000985 [Globomyces sp. JEL0801]